MSLPRPPAYTGGMESTEIDEIEQIASDAIRGRDCPGGQDVDAGIVAVVTVERDRRFLASTLHALFSQSVLPESVIIADCTGEKAKPLQTGFDVSAPVDSSLIMPVAGTRRVQVYLVGVDRARSFGDAVKQAVAQCSLGASARGLWMLHDDSRPADRWCLERLLETWHNTPTASVLGCKQLDWQGEVLHGVGAYAGWHRVISLVVDGEADQEQYDSRGDVYAVSLAGAVVSLAALHALQWPSPWFGTYGESADFCRRVCLSGGRVVVVPKASIAHRRARFDGVRSRSGRPLDEETPNNTTMERMIVAQRYRYTDMHRVWWPWYWLWSLVVAVATALGSLFSKQPYEAWCALRAPWSVPGSVFAGLKERRRLRALSTVSLSRLPMLVVNRHQLALWHDRREALTGQRQTILLSPLAKAHLRRRALTRFLCAAAMAIVAVLAVALRYRDVLVGVYAGGSLYSDQLLPTSAGFGQLFESATTPWVFGLSTGVPAPPTPWLLVWLVASLLTLGHVAAALPVIYLLSAPVGALSFWALAGVFTRSNGIRVVCGLLWAALGFGLGLYGTANLAMLSVMMFLPASFAFVFRAVGMYHTEDLVHPHSSVQAAGCSALCFIPVVAAEPQLLLPLIVIFVVFLILIPRHRGMLLLIPVPAAFVVAPTLVNAVRYASRGLWRQLFGDIAVPRLSRNGSPSALSLTDVVLRAFGLGHRPGDVSALSLGWLGMATLVSLIALLALAVAALFLPFSLRASRMMWAVIVSGSLLAMVSSRVVIGVDAAGSVAGSVEPGVCLVALGLLCCACQVAGGAVARYRPLSLSVQERDAQRQTVGRTQTVVRIARSGLVMVLAACVGLWFALGATRTSVGSVASGSSGLPMVAVDYLKANSAHRILALKADSRTAVSYTVMRTARGDLVDASPAQRVQMASGTANAHDALLSAAAAKLLANTDASSIEDIARLGFGGIYVVGSGSDGSLNASQRDAATELSTNITALEGVQSVVANGLGTYYRVTAVSDNASVGVDTGRQHTQQASAWRYGWLWATGIVLLVYCLVAIPRTNQGTEDES